jgi:hypothetical protein
MSGLSETTKGSFKKCVNTIRTRLLEDLEQACYQRYSLNARDRSKLQLTHQEARGYKRLFTWLEDPSRPHKDWKLNLKDLLKERAYTLTNRLVILMQLECRGLRKVKLISLGIEKSAFRTEQEFFVALTQGDDQGFGFILQQVWDQLALELPALFEYNEIHECIPIPGPTLLWLIQQLNQEDLKVAWTDDTSMGWLYQYWNDPDRKAVDKKLNTTSGKVEAHELSDKTQLFTERYMVEWLVQNSLGAQWLAICAKNGWHPTADQKIESLSARRKEWHQKILTKDVLETEAMPVNGDENFWKFYVPQELDEETIKAAPLSLDRVKILDPAMGSGHFLVYVFDFLWELYHDQARLQKKEYSPEQIIDWILHHNLHGIDIDNRAVQIGAAALYIKTQEKVAGYPIKKLNLVASDLGISHLDKDDPAILKFVKILEDELALNQKISLEIIKTLNGAEYLGSLLQVDKEIEKIVEYYRAYFMAKDIKEVQEKIFQALSQFIRDYDQDEDLGVKSLAEQMGKGLRLIELLGQKYDVIVANPPYLSKAKAQEKLKPCFIENTNELYESLYIQCIRFSKEKGFIGYVSTHNFLFLSKFEKMRKRIFRETPIFALAQLGVHTFHDVLSSALGITLVVFNKSQKRPKLSTFQRIGGGNDKTDPKFEEKIPLLISQQNTYTFPQSRFAEIPSSPMIYWWPEEFRQAYLEAPKLLDQGKPRHGMTTSNNNRFLRTPWEVLWLNLNIISSNSVNNQFSNSKWVPYVKGAAGKRWFEDLRSVIKWNQNGFEVKQFAIKIYNSITRTIQNQDKYFQQGLAFSFIGTSGFLCRLRKYKSIFDVGGSSIFCDNSEKMQVILSSSLSGYVSQSLNPTINNQVGDIENLPVLDQLSDYTTYLKRAEFLYDQLFSSTETNIEYTYQHLNSEKFEIEEARIRDDIDKELLQNFSQETINAIYQEIGESVFNFPHWNKQQESIPKDFETSYQAESSILSLSRKYRLHPDSLLQIKEELGLIHESHRKDKAFKHLSWAIGVLLGRFDAQTGGLIDLAEQRRKEQNISSNPEAPQSHAHGLLYLSVLDAREGLNRESQPNVGNACLDTLQSILHYKWGDEKSSHIWEEINNALVLECRTHWTSAQLAKKSLNQWIRTTAFDMHASIYQKRPIYFPLISSKRNFFLWVNIHKWNDGTLNSILANYLNPDRSLLEHRIKRLREERHAAEDSRQINTMEREIADLDKLLEELNIFTAKVTQLATRGPAPDIQEVEAPYVMDLDDGVMVNSAALWELVLPIWKDPKKWWTSLSTPRGKNDFDWSHLAMRYWPERVMEKVKQDPSLAVAHSDYGAHKGRDLFKELHPEAAQKWDAQQEKPKNIQMTLPGSVSGVCKS